MRKSVKEARRSLIRAGFGAELSAAAAARGSISGSSPEAQEALLEAIAAHLDSEDPMLIGAAWLLERGEYERRQ